MALTLNRFIGFETGGLEEAISTGGSPDATEATVVRSGIRSLLLPHSGTHQYKFNVFSTVADAGTDYVLGFAFRTDDITPAAKVKFLQVREGTNAIVLLQLAIDGDLELLDDAESIIGTAATPFTNNTWHFIEIYFQHSTSAAVEVFVDGASVIGPLSAKDLSAGGTLDIVDFDQISSNDTSNLYFDDFYFLSGATAASDRYGDFAVKTRSEHRRGRDRPGRRTGGRHLGAGERDAG